MDFFVAMVLQALSKVWQTFAVNWPYLASGAVLAALLTLYLDQERVARFLGKNQGRGVWAATAAAVGTPLCSCGTTAVVLGMMANRMPWAPVVAFMVASPLTSPQELVYSGGLFGWPFALAFFAASIVLGLAGGFAASCLEATGWLAGQARVAAVSAGGDRETFARLEYRRKPGWRDVLRESLKVARRILPRFVGFAFLGYLLNGLIPQEWMPKVFGRGRALGVPLAATLGLPLYLNTEASLPLLRAMMDGGMSPGAGLAFLIAGAGTSLGAVAGALTIARWRVVALVVATLWLGAIGFGWGYDALVALTGW